MIKKAFIFGKTNQSQNNYLSKREVYKDYEGLVKSFIVSQNNYLSKREVYKNCCFVA